MLHRTARVSKRTSAPITAGGRLVIEHARFDRDRRALDHDRP